MKYCNKCKNMKPYSEFNTNKSKKDGYQSNCKECRSTYNKEHYLHNKEIYKSRANNWKKENPIKILAQRYLVTEEEIKYIIKIFPNCAICGTSDNLVIDHCHKTGKIRGRLCNNCNRILGFIGDDLDNIIEFSGSAQKYLKNFISNL